MARRPGKRRDVDLAQNDLSTQLKKKFLDQGMKWLAQGSLGT
jgi:hypothetical protein